MKFSVQRDEMHQGVSAVQRATATRIIQPILANVCIVASKEAQTLTLTATDLDFSIETTFSATILEDGQTTLSAKKLLEILSKLPPHAQVEFDIDTRVQTAHIQCGNSQFDVRVMPAEEYPLIPQLAPTQQTLKISLPAFVKAINQTVFAAANYEASNVLGGVYFKLSPESLEMVATDGSRLARRMEVMTASSVNEPISAIIPARTMHEFYKLVGSQAEEDAMVEIAIHEGQIFLRTPKYRVVSRLLDGQYPKYEQLIPASNAIVAQAKRQELISSLERAAIMANERTNIVKMGLDQNALSLSANTPDMGDSKDMLSIEYQGDPFNIAFNYKYVLDALKVIESDDIRMETNGALAPTVFCSKEHPEYMCLVMPVQVK